MSAFTAIVRREVADHLKSLRFVVGTVFIMILFVAAASVLTAEHSERVRAWQEARAEHRESLRSAHLFSEVVVEVDRSPATLAVVSQGVDRALPTSSRFTVLEPPSLGSAGAQRNPLLVVLPSLDLVAVVSTVLSLLALVFAYDTVSGERSRGTLALALANPVPRGTLLLAKITGGLAVLLPLTAAGFALALGVLLASPLVHLNGVEWAVVGVVLLASAAFLTLIYLVGVVISIRTRSPGTSLVAALFTWVVLVLLLPQAATAMAAAVRPLESRRDLATAEQQVAERARARLVEYARSHPVPLPWDVQRRFNVERWSMYSGDIPMLRRLWAGPREYVEWALAGMRYGLPVLREAAEELAVLRRAATLEMAEQAELARRIRRLSPAGLYADAAAALVDTDHRRYLRFLAAAAEHRRRLLDLAQSRNGFDWRFFTRREALSMPTAAELEAMATSSGEGAVKELLGTGFEGAPTLDLTALGELVEPTPSLAARLGAAGWDVVGLVVLDLLLLLAAVVLFNRADVRWGGA